MIRLCLVLVGEDKLDRPLLHAFDPGSVSIEFADSLPYALAYTDTHHPDVLVTTHIPGAHDGLQLLRSARAIPDAEGIGIILIAEPGDDETRRAAWSSGADAVFTAPLDGAEFAACVMRVARERRTAMAADAFRQDADHNVNQLVALIIELMDVTVPGSAQRGEELAAGVDALAMDFGIGQEQRRDLELAARLHELARVTLGGKDVPAAGEGPGPSSRLTCATAALLRNIGALRVAAYLIDGMGAHWDGSGNPSEFQRGQIPMRSRLLRTVADLLAGGRAIPPGPGSPLVQAVEALADHAGTWYDPAIVAAVLRHVSDERGGPWRADDVEVTAVEQLRVGMVTADDMYTASGVKLLARATILTEALLDLVRQRHLIDPIVPGVHIRTGRRGRVAAPDAPGVP